MEKMFVVEAGWPSELNYLYNMSHTPHPAGKLSEQALHIDPWRRVNVQTAPSETCLPTDYRGTALFLSAVKLQHQPARLKITARALVQPSRSSALWKKPGKSTKPAQREKRAAETGLFTQSF